MDLFKLFPLILLILLLGCIQQPVEKTEEKPYVFTYGLSVDISGGNITITEGNTFSLMVSIRNNGDFGAVLKKVWLLGDILYIDGELTKTPDVTIHKKEVYVITFSPLTVSTTIGKKYFEFYPAICYSYSSQGKMSFYITTNDKIFVSYRDKPLKKSSTNSPLFVDFEGSPIYKLTESNGKFSGVIYFNIKVLGKNPNSWPVASCDDLSNIIVKNITLEVVVPHGVSLELKEGPWKLLGKGSVTVKRSLDKTCYNKCHEECCNNTEIIQSLHEEFNFLLPRIAQCELNEESGISGEQPQVKGGIIGNAGSTEDCKLEYINDFLNSLGDCLDDKSKEDMREILLREDLSKIDIEELYKQYCDETCVRKCMREIVEGGKTYRFLLDSSYYQYLRSKQGLRDIPISFEVITSEPVDLAEILMMVHVNYDFYEIFQNKKAVFKIV